VFLTQFYHHWRPNQAKIPSNESGSRQFEKANGVEEQRHAFWRSRKSDTIGSGPITAREPPMPKPKALPSPVDPVHRRAEELGALDVILPFDRRA
jgi:hypothetical protein